MYVTYIKSIKSNLINLKLSVNNFWDCVNKTWKLLDCKRPNHISQTKGSICIKITNVMQLGSMFICNCNIALHVSEAFCVHLQEHLETVVAASGE